MLKKFWLITFLSLVLFGPQSLQAQLNEPLDNSFIDSLTVEKAAMTYLKEAAVRVSRSNRRSLSTSKQFLKKIAKEERRIVSNMMNSDSAQVKKLNTLISLRYDSLETGLQNELGRSKLGKLKTKANLVLDSIHGVSLATGVHTNSLPIDLAKIRREAMLQQYIQQTILDRSKKISKILSGSKSSLFSVKYNKIVDQYRQQLNFWQRLNEEPSVLEEKSMDYLKGLKGFDRQFNTNSSENPLVGKTVTDLEAMGFQTKESLKNSLQEQFGDQLASIQQQAGKQVQQFTGKLSKPVKGITNAKAGISDGVKDFQEAKAKIKDIDKVRSSLLGKENVVFKNPIRGVPFWHRWALQYNFQTHPMSSDGLKPIVAQVGLNATYKSTPDFYLGFGIDGMLGLGRGWRHLNFTYEGFSVRSYLEYRIMWGIRLQGGYEYSFYPLNRTYVMQMVQFGNENNIRTMMGLGKDAAYLGLIRTYNISSERKGTLLVGYNFLNDKSKVTSPWIFRLGWNL